MDKKTGFTLIELLVVIAIIALLLSIIMPALKNAKESAKRAACLSNQRQLSISWRLYALDNDEKFCSPDPEDAFMTPGFLGWVSWEGTGWPADDPVWTAEEWELSIKLGAIWPYCNDRKVYRCPTGEKGEQITYAGFASFGWSQWTGPRPTDGKIMLNMSELKQPGTRSVFIDEGRLTSNFYSVCYDREQWWDQPTRRHSDGTTLAFADAHSEYWKWTDPRTREMCDMTWDEYYDTWCLKDCPDNPDLDRVRRTAWGKLGP